MKRFFYLFPLLLLTSFPIQAKNKISMVTYFPVPYVAYSQVNANEQMDIGLTSACDMKLGCSDSSTTLKAAQVNLTGGRLNLNGGRGILGDTLLLGSGNNVGQLSFQNVRIQTGNMESVNAEDIKTSNLNLFGKPFPSCKDANSKGGGQMSWQSLKLKGASSSELYLTCGPMDQSSACQPTDSRGATFTESCPSGQTGGPVKYIWNTSTCQYDISGSCEVAQVLVHCMTYHCKMGEREWADLPPGSVDELYTRFMGCKLPDNSPVNVTIYRKNMLKSSYSKWDTLYSGTQITDSCGWSTAFDNNYKECYYSFALNQSGASSITQTVDGKTYEIVLEQDSSDEDDGYYNPFCSLQHSSW